MSLLHKMPRSSVPRRREPARLRAGARRAVRMPARYAGMTIVRVIIYSMRVVHVVAVARAYAVLLLAAVPRTD